MNQQELDYMGQTLLEILNNDNIIRKQGESKLIAIKSGEPEKYACYLVAILGHRKYTEIEPIHFYPANKMDLYMSIT